MNKKPIIIIGFGRSGTSIISDIILRHRDLAFISNYRAKFPKLEFIDLLRLLFDNGLITLRGQKKQLNKVSLFNKFMLNSTEAYPFHNYINKLHFGKRFLNDIYLNEVEKSRIRAKYDTICKYQFKNRLGFKITGPSRLQYLNQIFPDALYIYVKRKPLPNIKSFLKVGFNKNRIHKLWWEGNDIYNNDELLFAEKHKERPELIAALQYFKVHQLHMMESEKLGLNDQIYNLDYEDFVNAPQQSIMKILKFSGLSQDSRITNLMDNLKIINRNRDEEYYFSENIDQEILEITLHGV